MRIALLFCVFALILGVSPARAQDYQDARAVARELGIVLHRVNFTAAYRERVRAELLAELGTQQATAEPATTVPAVMPSNLAGARNVGSRSSGPAYAGPTPLSDIFDRGKTAKAG